MALFAALVVGATAAWGYQCGGWTTVVWPEDGDTGVPTNAQVVVEVYDGWGLPEAWWIPPVAVHEVLRPNATGDTGAASGLGVGVPVTFEESAGDLFVGSMPGLEPQTDYAITMFSDEYLRFSTGSGPDLEPPTGGGPDESTVRTSTTYWHDGVGIAFDVEPYHDATSALIEVDVTSPERPDAATLRFEPDSVFLRTLGGCWPNTAIDAPFELTIRTRTVDYCGNAGPWSAPFLVAYGMKPEEAPPEPAVGLCSATPAASGVGVLCLTLVLAGARRR